MLSIEYEAGFNVFEWPDFVCPVCKKNEFVSADHTSVYCRNCNLLFVTRCTAGDPGVVVDALVYNPFREENECLVTAPLHVCEYCPDDWQRPRIGAFTGEGVICPKNLNHGQMRRVDGMYKSWANPQNVRRYTMVLKLAGDCYSWTAISRSDDKRAYDSHVELGFPTQQQWDDYQELMEQMSQ